MADQIPFEKFKAAAATKRVSGSGSATRADYEAFKTGASSALIRSKPEAVLFLAHTIWECSGFSQMVEQFAIENPVAAHKAYGVYHGRGPLQLTHHYNYRDAGAALRLDLLRYPDMVANDLKVGWNTAAWFWRTKVNNGGTFTPTFASSLTAINSNDAQPDARKRHYEEVRNIVG